METSKIILIDKSIEPDPFDRYNISASLLKASFTFYRTFIAPGKRSIIENYCACEGALTHSYAKYKTMDV